MERSHLCVSNTFRHNPPSFYSGSCQSCASSIDHIITSQAARERGIVQNGWVDSYNGRRLQLVAATRIVDHLPLRTRIRITDAFIFLDLPPPRVPWDFDQIARMNMFGVQRQDFSNELEKQANSEHNIQAWNVAKNSTPIGHL